MPELPEAETLVRGLRPLLAGRRLIRATVHRPDILGQPARRFRERVRDRRIRGVERRGKTVLLPLDDGVIAVQLGMTGWLAPLGFPGITPPRPTHPSITFRLDRGRLVYDDVRRFGRVEVLTADEWRARSRALGPEPLADDFTPEGLHAALARSRSPLRSWLLDQRRIAGVGNIYACEACFRAGVHPARPARTLDAPRAAALHGAIREVLTEAIAAGGTTIRDYRDARGEAGTFARRLAVYGREGEPCVRCGTPVVRTVFGGRSAFWCPTCQPPP